MEQPVAGRTTRCVKREFRAGKPWMIRGQVKAGKFSPFHPVLVPCRKAACQQHSHSLNATGRGFACLAYLAYLVYLAYLPMQKRLKISPSRSSVVTSPVIRPSADCAIRRSSAISSSGAVRGQIRQRGFALFPGLGDRFEMAPPGDEGVLAAFVGDEGFQVIDEQVDAVAFPGAQLDQGKVASSAGDLGYGRAANPTTSILFSKMLVRRNRRWGSSSSRQVFRERLQGELDVFRNQAAAAVFPAARRDASTTSRIMSAPAMASLARLTPSRSMRSPLSPQTGSINELQRQAVKLNAAGKADHGWCPEPASRWRFAHRKAHSSGSIYRHWAAPRGRR